LTGVSISETALSAELLKLLHSVSISLHPCPSSCLLSIILTFSDLLSLAGRLPSLPVPEFNPNFFRASSNPVLFNALLNGVSAVICSITFVLFIDIPVVVPSDDMTACEGDNVIACEGDDVIACEGDDVIACEGDGVIACEGDDVIVCDSDIVTGDGACVDKVHFLQVVNASTDSLFAVLQFLLAS